MYMKYRSDMCYPELGRTVKYPHSVALLNAISINEYPEDLKRELYVKIHTELYQEIVDTRITKDKLRDFATIAALNITEEKPEEYVIALATLKVNESQLKLFDSNGNVLQNSSISSQPNVIIPNNYSASSYLEDNKDKYIGTLNTNVGWGPKKGNETNSWWQFKLDKLTDIYGVALQGSPTNNEYVTKYNVQYSINGTTWLEVNNGVYLLGNTKPGRIKSKNEIVYGVFSNPVKALYIRILPI